jgi:hypothetical protein
MNRFLCAVGVSPSRPVAADGLYLRVSAVRRLRACTANLPRLNLQPLGLLVTTSLLKRGCSGPSGRGGVGLAGGQVCPQCQVLPRKGPGACDGRYFWCSSERAAIGPLHAKAFSVIHRVARDKDLFWNVMNRKIKTVK